MKEELLTVSKNSGENEPFSIQKLEQSLQSCGASKNEIGIIINKMQPNIYNGISSNDIYKKAFTLL